MVHAQVMQVSLSLVKKFVESKLLFWFEALSCLRAVSNAASALDILHRRLVSISEDVRAISDTYSIYVVECELLG
jgi:hypothetical protein